MASKVGTEGGVHRWHDPRFWWDATIFPAGVLVSLVVTALLAYAPYIIFFTPKGEGVALHKKVEVTLFVLAAFLYCCYRLVGFSQIFFVELRRKFVVWGVTYQHGQFEVRGYYFKRGRFHDADVLKIEPYYTDRRWFSNNMGTLLTRNAQSNLNYKLHLRDGCSFYFSSEIEQIESLHAMLSGLATVNSASSAAPQAH